MAGFRNRHGLVDRDRRAAEALDLAADRLAIGLGVTICVAVKGGRRARAHDRPRRRCEEECGQGDREQSRDPSFGRRHARTLGQRVCRMIVKNLRPTLGIGRPLNVATGCTAATIEAVRTSWGW
ncbi:hypothetical protein ACVWXL_003386 [Bradyrhizobium sp. GM22.5]